MTIHTPSSVQRAALGVAVAIRNARYCWVRRPGSLDFLMCFIRLGDVGSRSWRVRHCGGLSGWGTTHCRTMNLHNLKTTELQNPKTVVQMRLLQDQR